MVPFQFTSLRPFSLFVATWLCYQNIKLSFNIGGGDIQVGNRLLNIASEHTEYTSHTSSTKSKPVTKVPVFYNLYVANETDAARVKAFVTDQFSFLRPEHHPIYVNSIGYHIDIPNTTLLQHYDTASEAVTLQALWKYCKSHEDESVVYMHSKG